MLLITMSSVGFYACKKDSDSINEIPEYNKPLLVNSSNSVNLLFTDSVNSKSVIIRKIQLIDRSNNSVFDTFIMNLKVLTILKMFFKLLKMVI